MLSASDRAVILRSTLFSGIREEDFEDTLSFLNAKDRIYKKNQMIFLIGDPVENAGILLDGTVELSFLDESDNLVTMNRFNKGSLFGESLACAKAKTSPVQMRAVTECHIMTFNFDSMLHACQLAPGYQTVLCQNLLRDFARQNVFLNKKVRIMSQKRLRDRLRVFLRGQTISQDGLISLAFNRNELAEFLGVNRSALSRELSALQEEGVLTVEGRKLRILDRDFLLSE